LPTLDSSTCPPFRIIAPSKENCLTGSTNSVKDDSSSRNQDDDGAINPGSNLFVTGIHPKLSEGEVTRLFEKYGEVEKCQIMKDPHTKESRGFGFVKMVTSDQADAAKDGLQNEVIEGRTLSIEKARRARPRTPTPGKYFGPPKRGKCLSIS
jgi:transformer-2 protein